MEFIERHDRQKRNERDYHWEHLDDLEKAGLIRGIGLSNIGFGEHFVKYYEPTNSAYEFCQMVRQTPIANLEVQSETIADYAIALLKIKFWGQPSNFHSLGLTRDIVAHRFVDWIKVSSFDNMLQVTVTPRGQELIDYCVVSNPVELITKDNNKEPFRNYMLERIPYSLWGIILPQLPKEISQLYVSKLKAKIPN